MASFLAGPHKAKKRKFEETGMATEAMLEQQLDPDVVIADLKKQLVEARAINDKLQE